MRCRGVIRRLAAAACLAAGFVTCLGSSASAASSDFRVASGTYIGDGSPSLAFTNLGFAPDLVLIKGETNGRPAVVRTSTMSGDATKRLGVNNVPLVGNAIVSLDPDGFTIGAGTGVNDAGVEFHWIAMKAAAGFFEVGQYTGNGLDDQDHVIGFRPDYVMVLGDLDEHAMQRFDGQPPDKSFEFKDSDEKADRIQAFNVDGFQVGKHNTVNKDTFTYHYAAWKAFPGGIHTNAYSGIGTPGFITQPGFAPDFVLIKRYGNSPAVKRTASVTGDVTLPADDTPAFTGGITSMRPVGFDLGVDDSVNKSGQSYSYAAFRNQAVPTIANIQLKDASGNPVTTLSPTDTMLVEFDVTHPDGFLSVERIEVELWQDTWYQMPGGHPARDAVVSWDRSASPKWQLDVPQTTTWAVVPERGVIDTVTDATTAQTITAGLVVGRVARAGSNWGIEVRVFHASAGGTKKEWQQIYDCAPHIDVLVADSSGVFSPGAPGATGLPLITPTDSNIEVKIVSNAEYDFKSQASHLVGQTNPLDTLYITSPSRIAYDVTGGAPGWLDTTYSNLISNAAPSDIDDFETRQLSLWIDHPPGQPLQTYAGQLDLRMQFTSGGGDTTLSIPIVADVSAGNLAATGAIAEVFPDSVTAGRPGQTLDAFMVPDIQGGDTGVDRVLVNVPPGYGDPIVTGVLVGLTPRAFSDSSVSGLVDVRISPKVTSASQIQVFFTVDAPTAADSVGQDFNILFDDTGTPLGPQAAVEGNAGGVPNADTWRVRVLPTAPAAIDVTPNTAIVFVDSTAQFSAAVVDSFGNPVAANVTWSDAGGVGTVDAAGLFTATGVGSGQVMGDASGLSDTSDVTVETTPGIAVRAITGPATVTLGQNGFPISMRVENLGSEPVRLDSVGLDFTRVTRGDSDAEFAVIPSATNPDTIPGAQAVFLDFDVSVSGGAAAGTISVDGDVGATTIGSNLAAVDLDADSTLTLVLQTPPSLTAVAATLSPTTVTQGQTGVGFSIDLANAGQAGIATGAGSVLKILAPADTIVVPYSGTIPEGATAATAIGPTWTFGPATIPGAFPTGVHRALLEISSIDDNGRPYGVQIATPESVTVQGAGPNVTIAATQVTLPIVPDGSTQVPLMGLAIAHDDPGPLTLTEIEFTNASVGPGNDAQLDGNFGPLTLWADDGDGKINPAVDTLLLTGSLAGRTANFSPLSFVIPSGAVARLLVGASASTSARDGDTLDVVVFDTWVRFTQSVNFTNTWPIDTPGGLVVDGMSAAQALVIGAPSELVDKGTQRVLAMEVRVPPNGYTRDTLNAVRVVNLGDAVEAVDIENVEIWRAGVDPVYDAGAGDDVLLGSATWDGSGWELAGLTEAALGAGRRLYVSVDVAATATDARTIDLAIPSGVPLGLTMASNNDGPVDTLISAQHTLIVRADTTTRVSVSRAVQTPQTLNPGLLQVELLELGLINSAASAETLSTLSIANATSGPGTPAELDAEWTTLTLSSGGNDVGTATFSGGRAVFTGLNLELPPGLEVVATVRGGAGVIARDGDVLDFAITDASQVSLRSGAGVSGMWPIDPPGGFIVDGMTSAQLTLNPIVSGSFSTGSARNLALDFVVPPNGYETDIWNRINVVNTGTAITGADIEGLEAWIDDTDGIFNPLADQLVGALTFTGNRWELTGLVEAVPAAGARVFITCDVAEFASEGVTVQLGLPALPDVALGMASSNDGPIDVAVVNPSPQSITSADRMTLTAVSLPPRSVPPGDTNVELLHLDMTNTYPVPKSLTGLTVTNTTVGGGTPVQLDGTLSRVVLREDGNDDGVLGNTTVDPIIGTGLFSGGKFTFSGLSWTVPAAQTRRLFVTADIAVSAAADGDVVDAEVAVAGDLTFSDVTTVAAAWPVTSNAQCTIDGMVAQQITRFEPAAATLGPNEGPVVVFDASVPRNGYADDVLRGIVLSNLGSAVGSDLAEIRLWLDGGNGTYDNSSGDDTDLGAMSYVAGNWSSPVLSVPLSSGGARLFAAAVAGAAPTDSATVRLSVPLNGITVDSGNDGPIDIDVQNSNTVLLSTTQLLTSMEITTNASVVGQTVIARMVVRNTGTADINTVAPSGLAASGSGLLTVQSGPTPATFDLAPGVRDTFTWTLRSDVAGDVRLAADASGIESGSGLPRQSLASESNEHQVFVEAQDIDMFPVESMPFSVNRGQSDVAPLSLTFENPAGLGGSSVRLLSMRLQLEDEFGAGIVPADLLDRVVVQEGSDLYLDKTALETSGNEVDLTLALPAVIEAGGESSQITLSLSLDISQSTTVPSFRVGLIDSTMFLAEDATSGAPVTVRLQGASYPVRSGLARIGAEATLLEVVDVPDSSSSVVQGQAGVSMLEMDLTNVDPSGLAADIRVARFDVSLLDSTGTPVPDPTRYLDRIRVRSALQTHLDRAVGAGDDSLMTVVLSPLSSAPSNTPIRVTVEADFASDSDLGSVRLALADTSMFDARDANTQTPVTVTYNSDPMSGAARTVQSPAESLHVWRVAGIEPVVTIGQADVAAMTIRMHHPGGPEQSSIHVDSLSIRVLDQLANPVIPALYIDRVQALVSGSPVGIQIAPPGFGSTIVIPLSGLVIVPGGSLEIAITFDVEATAPESFLQLEIQGAGLHAFDGNSDLPVAVNAHMGQSLPIQSGLAELRAPARQLVVGFQSLMPAALAADGALVPFAALTLTNTAGASAGSIRLDHFRIRASDVDFRGMNAGSAVARIEAWVADTLWGQTGALTVSDLEADVQGSDTLRVAPGSPVVVELRMVTRVGTTVPNVRLGGDNTSIGVIQPGSALLAVSVVAASGQAFPFWSDVGNFGGASLAESYSNFPNPFAAGRENTTFAFYLDSDAQVTLTLWTGRGERVRRLLDAAALPAGLHQNFAWDGRNGRGGTVYNGVYVAELDVRYDDGRRERQLRKVAVVR